MARRNGCRHGEGEHHDCDYVDAIDRIVPVAERSADGHMVALGLETCEHHDMWSRVYHSHMAALTKAAGLRANDLASMLMN